MVPLRSAAEANRRFSQLLRAVREGDSYVVTAHGKPVAKIIPMSRRSRWLPATEIGRELARLGPDTTGLAEELRQALTDTTDDLPW